MAFYEPVKHWVYRNTEEEQHWLGPVIAGAAAGAAASLTRVPTEVIKQRLQTREFAGAVGAVSGARAGGGVWFVSSCSGQGAVDPSCGACQCGMTPLAARCLRPT